MIDMSRQEVIHTYVQGIELTLLGWVRDPGIPSSKKNLARYVISPSTPLQFTMRLFASCRTQLLIPATYGSCLVLRTGDECDHDKTESGVVAPRSIW